MRVPPMICPFCKADDDSVIDSREADSGAALESEFRKELRECPPQGRRALLAEHIGALASEVIGFSPDQVLDPDAGFFKLGMDSLMSVTLQRRLSASLGIALPASMIFESPTISSLTDTLCERLGYVTEDQAPTAARSGLGARAQLRARLRRGAQASRPNGHGV